MISDLVGVVVIGRNEGERLIRCLSSIGTHAHPIVYVDSGSTDGSIAAAQRLGAFVVRLDAAQPFTAGRARNSGVSTIMERCPDVKYIQFVDGDCELVDGFIDAALSFLASHPGVAVVCGRRQERHPEVSLYNRLCDIEWNTPVGEALSCGGDSLIRVDAFASVGGFRPELIAGEEPELCLRLRRRGWKIWRIDREMTLHDAAMTRFGQWWRRAIRSGYGGAALYWLHRGTAVPGPTLYGKETMSIIFWGGLLPAIIVVACLFRPYILFVTAIYPLQVGRIAVRRGIALSRSWAYAFFTMLAKFAAFYGMVKYCCTRLTQRSMRPKEYK
jgi:GT2 family glycosyltransferase